MRAPAILFLLLAPPAFSQSTPSDTTQSPPLPTINPPLTELRSPTLYPLKGTWWFTPLIGTNAQEGPLEVPHHWDGHGSGEYQVLLQLPPSSDTFTILAPNSVYTAAKFYINGRLVAEQGVAGPDSQRSRASNLPVQFDLPREASIVLTVRAVNFENHQGGILNSLLIGTKSAVERYIRFGHAIDWFFIGIFLIFALYHAALFAAFPSKRETFFFALFTFVLAFRVGSTGLRVLTDLFPLDYRFLRTLELTSWYLAIPLAYEIMKSVFPNEASGWAAKILAAGAGLLSAAALVLPNTEASYTIYPGMVLSVFAVALTVGGHIAAFLRGRQGAVFIGVGFIIIGGTIIYDILIGLEIIEGYYLLNFGLVSLVASQGAWLLVQFVRSFQENERLRRKAGETADALRRFVPMEFLQEIGETDLTKIRLGTQVVKNETVLFSDIRGFTTMSEKLPVQTTMEILQRYLGPLSDTISRHGGFVDKFLGDGIMAIFPGKARDALDCGIAMQKTVRDLNKTRAEGLPPVRIGIGIHSGPLVMGILGTPDRMEPSVIADTVNIASRLEHLCKKYGSWLLITQDAFFNIPELGEYKFRILQRTHVKGRREPINVIEVFDPMPPKLQNRYFFTQQNFEMGLLDLLATRYTDAIEKLEKVQRDNPHDLAAYRFLQLARKRQSTSGNCPDF